MKFNLFFWVDWRWGRRMDRRWSSSSLFF